MMHHFFFPLSLVAIGIFLAYVHQWNKEALGPEPVTVVEVAHVPESL